MNRKNMLYLFWASFLIIATMPFSIAGNIVSNDEKTTIKVRIYDLPKSTDPSVISQANVAVYMEFINRFPEIFKKRLKQKFESNPDKYGKYNWNNVEVLLEPFSGIKVEGVESDLLAIAGGMAPDIIYVNFRKSNSYIMNHFLYPLDEYFSELSREQIEFRINKKVWPVIKRKGPDKNEHIWALPVGGALGKVLLYRKDLFDAANIAYPTTEWTWNELYDTCKKLTKPEKSQYGMALGAGKHESWYWVTFLWSAGGDVMRYDEEKDEWSCVFDSPEAITALEFYNRISNEKWTDNQGNIRRGYVAKDASITSTKWERGEVGMKLDYVDEKLLSKINPEVTGMVPVPIGPTGIRGGELNCRMFGLYSQITEPAVRDVAWEYMRFYTSIDAERIRTKVMVEGGMGRFINPKYLRMFGYNEIEKLAPKGWAETFNIAIETGIPEPYGKNSNVAYDMMTMPIQQLAAMSLSDELPENREELNAIISGLLKDACDRANEVMIGKLTEQEISKRRIVAVIVLLGIFFAFFFIFRRIIKAFTPKQAGLSKRTYWDFRKYFWAYILLIPAVLAIFIWQYIPLLRGSAMAFYDYKLIGKSAFIGVDNFGNLIFDNAWWSSVYNAFRYSLLVLALTFLPPIILAILLQEVPKGKIIFRTIYYLPAVVTGVVTILLWKQFYDPSEYGALNGIIMKVPAIGFVIGGLVLFVLCYIFAKRLWLHEMYVTGWCCIIAGGLMFITVAGFGYPILVYPNETVWQASPHCFSRLFDVVPEPYRWLVDPDTAMRSCVLPMVWAGMGPGCLIYLAALKGIPEDYYEASDIDGANFIDKILFVVFPMLKSLIIINFVGAFIQSWYHATGNILVMTGGGANTETAGLHIWYKAFTFLQFGPATAMAWMLGFILIGFTVNQLRILSKVEFRAQGTGK